MNENWPRPAVIVLIVLEVLWVAATLMLISLMESFDYGNRSNPLPAVLLTLLVPVVTHVVLHRTGNVLLAYAVFLTPALLLFGVCAGW